MIGASLLFPRNKWTSACLYASSIGRVPTTTLSVPFILATAKPFALQ